MPPARDHSRPRLRVVPSEKPAAFTLRPVTRPGLLGVWGLLVNTSPSRSVVDMEMSKLCRFVLPGATAAS